jgi:hypothetical protein
MKLLEEEEFKEKSIQQKHCKMENTRDLTIGSGDKRRETNDLNGHFLNGSIFGQR